MEEVGEQGYVKTRSSVDVVDGEVVMLVLVTAVAVGE